MWITVETTVLYDKGAFTGLQHKWTFDEFYTAMAIEGLDKNKDGIYDREELSELAKVNIDGLKEFGYFTYPLLAGQEVKIQDPKDYWLEHKDGALSLIFTVPFAQPVPEKAKGFAYVVEDPGFYIAFVPAKTDPVKLGAGAPKSCKVTDRQSQDRRRRRRAPRQGLCRARQPRQRHQGRLDRLRGLIDAALVGPWSLVFRL